MKPLNLTLKEMLDMPIDDVLKIEDVRTQQDIFNIYSVSGQIGKLCELKDRYDKNPDEFSHIPEPLQVRHMSNERIIVQ